MGELTFRVNNPFAGGDQAEYLQWEFSGLSGMFILGFMGLGLACILFIIALSIAICVDYRHRRSRVSSATDEEGMIDDEEVNDADVEETIKDDDVQEEEVAAEESPAPEEETPEEPEPEDPGPEPEAEEVTDNPEPSPEPETEETPGIDEETAAAEDVLVKEKDPEDEKVD